MVNPSFLSSQQQQQGKASTPSPVPHSLASTTVTPPGTRHFIQDSSSSKPPAPAPSATPTPTTPSSTVTYINIDLIGQKPPQFGSKASGGSVAKTEPASGNTTAEGYATYPGPAHHHPEKPRTSRVELPPGGIGGETPRRKWQQQDCAAMIVWLERFEDHASFPVNVLTKLLHSVPQAGPGSHKPFHSGSRKSLPILFIHKMTSGLYQIVTKNTTSRSALIISLDNFSHFVCRIF